MNKEELIEQLAAIHKIPKTEAGEIILTLLSLIQQAVVSGDKVTLVGFGIFEAQLSKPRTGHNPRTGTKVHIIEKRRPKFKPGLAFRNAVAEKNSSIHETKATE